MDNDNGVKVEDMFAECDSPSLIEIYSSCDIKVRLFYYLIGGKTGHLYSEIIQVFDFISNELSVKSIGAPPPILRGPFIIPLGYKHFRTPLDAIFGSYPMDIFIPPLGYRFYPLGYHYNT